MKIEDEDGRRETIEKWTEEEKKIIILKDKTLSKTGKKKEILFGKDITESERERAPKRDGKRMQIIEMDFFKLCSVSKREKMS